LQHQRTNSTERRKKTTRADAIGQSESLNNEFSMRFGRARTLCWKTTTAKTIFRYYDKEYRLYNLRIKELRHGLRV